MAKLHIRWMQPHRRMVGEAMICPDCEPQGLKSRVRCHGGTSTLMFSDSFYDEEGYHFHDPNGRTSEYSCSNGHQFIMSYLENCPNAECDYGADTMERVS
jgi:hypothetical protein